MNRYISVQMVIYLSTLVDTGTYNWENFCCLQTNFGSVHVPSKVRNSELCIGYLSLLLIYYKEQSDHKHFWNKKLNTWIFLLSIQWILEYCLHHLCEKSTILKEKYPWFLKMSSFLFCLFLISKHIHSESVLLTYTWPYFPRVN